MNEDRDQRSEIGDQNDDQTSQQAPLPDKGGVGGGFEDRDQILAERDEYLAGWKRAKADYDNVVKDMDRKRAEYADWATEQVLSRILPAIDQFDTALRFTPSLDVIPEDQRKSFQVWITGLQAVHSLWMDAAKELGLELVSITGAFDPSKHEAVGEEEDEAVPAGQIIKATMNGYMMKGKVIRCAKVIVSK